MELLTAKTVGATAASNRVILGRAPSTVSRESARNTTRGRPYRACTAHRLVTAFHRRVW
ncbi:MAG: hypothetical protein SGJ26_06980 [Nitrospirota bacterium]|nr:hypothetical protein [Nitrospirota bacterium]